MKPVYLLFAASFFILSCTKKENNRPQPSDYPGTNVIYGTVDNDSIELYTTGSLIRLKNGNYNLNLTGSKQKGQLMYLRFANITLNRDEYRIYPPTHFVTDTTNAYYKPIHVTGDEEEYRATGGWLGIYSVDTSNTNGKTAFIKGSFYFTTGSANATYIKGTFGVSALMSEE